MSDMTSAAQVHPMETTRSSTPSAQAGTVTVDCSGIRWLVRGDAAEALFGPDAPSWSDLMREPRASSVKAGFRRMTWRITLANRAVYAKVLHGQGLLDHVKSRCALSGVHREWRAARKADALGIPVAKPLAVGVRCSRPPMAIYVCEAVEDARPLPEAWKEDGTANHTAGPTRRALIAAVARLYAVAHHHGMYHTDGHPNNVLVRSRPTMASEAVFIDLPWVQIRRRPLGTNATAASLAQLDHYFRRAATKTDRLRFVHAYYAARHAFEDDCALTDRIRILLAAIAEARGRHTFKLAARRDRRLRGKSAYFQRIRLGRGWSGLFAMRLGRRHVFDLTGQPDRTEADWRRIVRKITELPVSTPLTECSALRADGFRLDTAQASGLHDRFWWTLRGSPQLDSFLEAHRRRHRDEPAPLLLGYAERRRGGLVDLTVTFRPEAETVELPQGVSTVAERPHGAD